MTPQDKDTDNKRDVSQLVDLQESSKAIKTDFSDNKVEQMQIEELKLQLRQHQKLHDQIIKLVLAIKKDSWDYGNSFWKKSKRQYDEKARRGCENEVKNSHLNLL